MPELPEVETTVRGLRKYIVGLKIVGFWCDWSNIIRYLKPSDFARKIKNAKIIKIRRRGKNIIVDLDNKKTLVVHMKMTGHLMVGKYRKTSTKHQTWVAKEAGPLRDDPYNQYIHAVFILDNKHHLVFCDARKFGKIALYDTANLLTSKELAHLGPELWETSAKQFLKIIKDKSKSRIKQALLNQAVVAGIGNIYCDESLWASGIHPLSVIKSIPDKKIKDLRKFLVKITKASMKTGGDSTSDYRNIDGAKGGHQNLHKVYQQLGKKCSKPKCSGIIQRIIVAMRGTHFCPGHQRLYEK